MGMLREENWFVKCDATKKRLGIAGLENRPAAYDFKPP